jgi:hypothetical protein
VFKIAAEKARSGSREDRENFGIEIRHYSGNDANADARLGESLLLGR